MCTPVFSALSVLSLIIKLLLLKVADMGGVVQSAFADRTEKHKTPRILRVELLYRFDGPRGTKENPFRKHF